MRTRRTFCRREVSARGSGGGGLREGEDGNGGGLIVLDAEDFEEAGGEKDEEFVKTEKRDSDEKGAESGDGAGKWRVGGGIEMFGLALEIFVAALASHAAEVRANEESEENREEEDDDAAGGDVAVHEAKPRRERERYSTVTWKRGSGFGVGRRSRDGAKSRSLTFVWDDR